jgi:DNA-binding SARP family transcriptional activator
MENRSAALRLYKTLKKKLNDELGIEPQAELETLYRSLLKK